MFDFHAHAGESTNDAFVTILRERELECKGNYRYFSLGFLPWLDDSFDFARYLSLIENSDLPVGEVGLDRRYNTPGQEMYLWKILSSISPAYEQTIDDLEDSYDSIATEQSTQNTNIASLQDVSNTLQTACSYANTQVNLHNSQISTINTNLTNLTNKVEDLEDTVLDLNTGASSSTYEVVYDRSSTDTAVNHNYPNGIKIGYSLTMDLSKYTYLRVFFSLENNSAQSFIKLTDRERPDFLAIASNTSTTKYYTVKFSVPLTLSRFVTNLYNIFTFDSSGNFTREVNNNNEDFYVYRIEGYL